jgi:hypothetical protein
MLLSEKGAGAKTLAPFYTDFTGTSPTCAHLHTDTGPIGATSKRSIQGTTPQDFPIKGVDTEGPSTDVIIDKAQKERTGGGALTVQIVVDGVVVNKASTTADYGLAQVRWKPAK